MASCADSTASPAPLSATPVTPSGAYQYVTHPPRILPVWCSICDEPFIDPCEAPCRHNFCTACLTPWALKGGNCPECRAPLVSEDGSRKIRRCVDKTLLTLLGNLEVYCTNKGGGCMWKGPRANLDEHAQRNCGHHACVHSSRGCPWRGRLLAVDGHVTTTCNYAELPCPQKGTLCGFVGERRRIAEHLRDGCPAVIKAAQEAKWSSVKDVCARLNPTKAHVLTLNVGGRVLMCSRQSLCKYPLSLLGLLFSGDNRPLEKLDDGSVFIDRNGDTFGLLVEWLRGCSAPLDRLSQETREQLCNEATFWQLEELAALLQPPPAPVVAPQKDPPAANELQPSSKLDKPVQDVVSMIFDTKMMERTLTELGLDVKKMPLGELTKKQVKDGYLVLKEIEEILSGKKRGDLVALSSRFYTLIPHNLGHVPPSIKTLESLKQKMNLLEAMADVELAQAILKETEKGDTHNLIDANYAKLKCKIQLVDKDSEEYKQIAAFIAGNQEKGRQVLELMDLFVVHREGERQRLETTKHIGNRKLLWHGSRLTSFAGILSQGLRIAPPEAPACVYRFGKGLYFADIVTLSSMCCRTSLSAPVGLMLLCDTALGKAYEATRDQCMDKAPVGFDSTWALGRVEPDPKGEIKHPEGYVIPAGKIGDSGRKDVSCHEHQFIIYNEAQSEMKYLLKFRVC